MSQAVVLDIMKDALTTIIMIAGPILVIALLVGLLISILQATTQIQEQTLTFVPKILAVFLSLFLFGSFMLNTLVSFANRMFGYITNIIQ
jgi:flagellar biosynthetic protein FliQ